MDSYNYTKTRDNIKDISKGQKITAALYLVTGHLSDTDPMKNALRAHAVTVSTGSSDSQKTVAAQAIQTLLGAATIAGIISEKNASIISLELRHYVVHITTEPDAVSSLFTPVLDTQSYKPSTMSISSNNRISPMSAKMPVFNENKSKRQDAILSFINERKSVGIKDIAALFSDTSEKTIQRELGALVATGKITKRGEKRWSIYLAM
jgi:hypothetical protein